MMRIFKRLGYLLLGLFFLFFAFFSLFNATTQFKISCEPRNQKKVLCRVEKRPLYGLFTINTDTTLEQPTSITLYETTRKKPERHNSQLFWMTPTGKVPLTPKIKDSKQETINAKQQLEKFLLDPVPIEIYIQSGRDSWFMDVYLFLFLLLGVFVFFSLAWTPDEESNQVTKPSP